MSLGRVEREGTREDQPRGGCWVVWALTLSVVGASGGFEPIGNVIRFTQNKNHTRY